MSIKMKMRLQVKGENTLELTVEMAYHPKEVKDPSYNGIAVSDSEHSTAVCSCGIQDV
jgi:hypothetical protein